MTTDIGGLQLYRSVAMAAAAASSDPDPLQRVRCALLLASAHGIGAQSLRIIADEVNAMHGDALPSALLHALCERYAVDSTSSTSN